MTLEEFAKKSGVTIVECGPGWGGPIGYTLKDSPNVTECGHRTEAAAYKHWAKSTFGEKTAKAIMGLLKQTEEHK